MDPIGKLQHAFWADDAIAFRHALERHPELKEQLSSPIGPFDSPAICHVRSREMLDVLLDAGADINGRSQWWAGGFGLLDLANDNLAEYAISRGAIIGAHAAARLGKMERLQELLDRDLSAVHAPGGDGKTPLHFARNVEIAKLLLDHGARIDARDVDHESTPAQHLIDERPEVARYLVERGATADIFLAAALGDVALLNKHLRDNPEALHMRINPASFPMANPRAGGTIYQWTLGFNVSPHQVAKRFGHDEAFKVLMDASAVEIQLINWCWLGEEDHVKQILNGTPRVAEKVSEYDRIAIADAARNNEVAAVRLMLMAGLPIDARGQHRATALHWAAWHGNSDMVRILLRHNAPVDIEGVEHGTTPLQWCLHGSENGWHRNTGNYPAVVKQLLAAGAKIPEPIMGTSEVLQALRG